MSSSTENLDIVVSLRGGRVAAAEARAVEQAVGGIANATRTAAAGSAQLAEQTRRSSSILGGTIGLAVRYSAAYAGIHEAMKAVGAGFSFDATMEQNTIAFTHFLGSAQAAHAELATLYQIAAKTPFEFKDVTTATRRFLAFGFSLQQANDELNLIGDAIAGVGGGSDEINRMVLVLGQINAAGKLQGQDLLQLEQLGIVSRVQIAQNLGLSVEKFNTAMRDSKISSADAINAINTAIRTQFAGSAEEQSRSVRGQLSTIHDYASQAAGALVQPIFDLAKSDVLPSIANWLQQASSYLKGGGATSLYSSLGNILKIVGPLVGLFVAYKAALLGVAAAERAVAAATVLMGLASTLTTVITLVPAITSLADVFYLLSVAVGAVGLSLGAVMTLGVAAVIAGLIYAYLRVRWFHDAVNAVFNFIKGHWPLLLAILAGPFGLAVLAIVKNFDRIKRAVSDTINWIKHAWGTLNHVLGGGGGGGGGKGGGGGGGLSIGGIAKTLLGAATGIPLFANGGTLTAGGVAIVGDAGPEILRNRNGVSEVTPLGPSALAPKVLQPIILQVDGKVLGQAVVDVGATAAARR